MTKNHATLSNGEMLSTAYLREPVRTILSAAPNGMGEAMLVHIMRVERLDMSLHRYAPAYMVRPDGDNDPWVRKVRQTCKLLGARRDEHGVWSLPKRVRRAA